MTKYDTEGAFEALREDPFLPPAPAPATPKLGGWAIAGLIVLGLIIFGAVSNASEDDVSSTPSTSVGLVSYDGTSVEEMAGYVIGTSEHETVCELTPIVGYDEARQSYLDAEPQLGSDAYEGAVFDAMMAAC